MATPIYHFKSVFAPEYRFEYHSETKKLYVIRAGSKPEVGELMADDVVNAALAVKIGQSWLKGYHEAKRVIAPKVAEESKANGVYAQNRL